MTNGPPETRTISGAATAATQPMRQATVNTRMIVSY
jgi:hypothetical protein